MGQDAVLTRLDAIQTSIDTLARGLGLIVETLGTHGEMLGHLLEAASQTPPGEGDLGRTLVSLARAVTENTEALARMETELQGLPEAIARAVVDGEV